MNSNMSLSPSRPLGVVVCSSQFLSSNRRMMLTPWCFIFAFVPLVVCDRSSLPSTTTTTTTTTDQIIYALARALRFFSLHIDQVNLDAGIGTRIAADQLRSHTTGKHGKSIRHLVDFSDHVTRQIAQSVRHRQADYYAQLSFLLMPGMFSRTVPFELRAKKSQINVDRRCSSLPFIEKYSDQCLHALAFSKCNGTESCGEVMSDPHACRYSLTHQILYSILAKKSSCSHHRLLTNDEDHLVARMLEESHTIAKDAFRESDRDLFMEQLAFGGLLGWSDFFQHTHWFHAILSWQHPAEGCYGNDTIQVQKREEMQMPQLCLSHRTSVAIAALAEMLRYLLSRDI